MDAFLGLVGGLAAIAIAALLAIWQLRIQKEWEKKLQYYEDILSALHEMTLLSERYLDEMLGDENVPDEEADRLAKAKKDAENKIYRLLLVGRLVIPTEIIDIVHQLLTDIRKNRLEDDFWTAVMADNKKVNEAIKKFAEHAKRDLKKVSLRTGTLTFQG